MKGNRLFARGRLSTLLIHSPLLVSLALPKAHAIVGIADGFSSFPAESRYLYALGCAANLDKLDTWTGRLVSSSSLADHTKLIHLHGDVAGSTFDGCATSSPLYHAANAVFYTLSPTTGSYEEDDQQHFRLLSFRVPALKLVAAVGLPRPSEKAPRLESTLDGQILLVQDSHRYESDGSSLQPAAPANAQERVTEVLSGLSGDRKGAASIDLRQYAAPSEVAKYADGESNSHLTYEPIESSGDAILFDIAGVDVYAVLHTSERRIILLKPSLKTSAEGVHLIAGGANVLVQEVKPRDRSSVPLFGGTVQLLDSESGSVLRTQPISASHGVHVLTVTPTGKLVYFDDSGRYHFLPGFGTHPNLTVTRLLDKTGGPGYFYADR